MKNGVIVSFALSIIISCITIFAIIFVPLYFVPKTPLTLEEKELQHRQQLLQQEIKYNQTHGIIVRIEKVEYKNFYGTQFTDYAYVVSLFDGNSVIKTRERETLQLFEVGDIVVVGDTEDWIYLEKVK